MCGQALRAVGEITVEELRSVNGGGGGARALPRNVGCGVALAVVR